MVASAKDARRFPRNFRGHPTQTSVDGQLIYRDVLSNRRLPPTIDVVLDDIIAHDAALAKALRDQPNVYFPILEDALKDVKSLRGSAGTLETRGRTRNSDDDEEIEGGYDSEDETFRIGRKYSRHHRRTKRLDR